MRSAFAGVPLTLVVLPPPTRVPLLHAAVEVPNELFAMPATLPWMVAIEALLGAPCRQIASALSEPRPVPVFVPVTSQPFPLRASFETRTPGWGGKNTTPPTTTTARETPTRGG